MLEARSQRFQRPIDAQASAVAVQVARRASFAHVPSGNVTIHMPDRLAAPNVAQAGCQRCPPAEGIAPVHWRAAGGRHGVAR